MKHFLLKLTTPALAAATLLGVPAAQANEQIFAYSYLAETLPAGVWEVENLTTYRTKKSQGTYRLLQNRTELEYGVTDRWMVSMYVNSYSVTARDNNSIASRNSPGGGPTTLGSYVADAETLPFPSARYGKSDFESVSLESIYQLLSPYKDGIGLAAYGEITHGPRVTEVELKALVQKNLLDDQLILAGNAAVEFERENFSRTGFEKEAKLVFSGGASYRFAPGWRAGVEMVNQRGYAGHSLSSGNREYSAWHAGPNISYASRRWFATLTWLDQLPWSSAYTDEMRLERVNGRVYKDTERTSVRLRVGFLF